jgi:hypothetical protein
LVEAATARGVKFNCIHGGLSPAGTGPGWSRRARLAVPVLRPGCRRPSRRHWTRPSRRAWPKNARLPRLCPQASECSIGYPWVSRPKGGAVRIHRSPCRSYLHVAVAPHPRIVHLTETTRVKMLRCAAIDEAYSPACLDVVVVLTQVDARQSLSIKRPEFGCLATAAGCFTDHSGTKCIGSSCPVYGT